MQKTEFEVSLDKRSMVLGDSSFCRVDCEVGGEVGCVMENLVTKEKVLLQQYGGLEPGQIEEAKRKVVEHFFPNAGVVPTDRDEESLEAQIIDKIISKRELKNVVYPYFYTAKAASGGTADFFTAKAVSGGTADFYTAKAAGGGVADFFTVSDLPENFAEKYCPIDKAAQMQNFSLHARVMASLNLSDTVVGMYECFGELIYAIGPDAVFINTENGDVRILAEKCLDFGLGGEGMRNYEYRFSLDGWGTDSAEDLGEMGLLRFLEYAAFRFLCMDDPFDGSETLMQYPCLTNEALRKIHSGEYGFIFSETENKCSEYIGQNAFVRWKALPAFAKEVFGQVFSHGPDGGGGPLSLAGWQKEMRRLRDCLVYVNNQFRLCDPDVSNKVLFMEVNGFQIPVWFKKAIYWYHVGLDYEAQANGLIGGINAEGFLENRSLLQWVIEIDKKTFIVFPGHSVKLEEGMTVRLTDRAAICVVSGEKPVAGSGLC